MDTPVDRKLPNYRDSASIFSKVVFCKLSHSSSADLYWICWMDFASKAVQTKAPHFVELELPAVNTSDELGILSTPATRIRRQTDGSHWSAPDHVFWRISSSCNERNRVPEQDYSYKTGFGIWLENQDFGRQNISMS